MNNKNEISKLNLKKCLELKDEDKIYQFLFDKVFLFYPWYISVYDKCHRIIMTSKSQENEYLS